MEQKKMLLAVVLMFLIIFSWQMMMGRKGMDTQQPLETITAPAVKAPVAEAPTRSAMTASDRPEKAFLPLVHSRTILVDTPLYQVEISETGAVFQSFKLKNYRETLQKDSSPKELIDAENMEGMLLARLEGNTVPGLTHAVYTAGVREDRLSLTRAPMEIPFSWTSENGVTFQKIFKFFPDTYRIDVELIIRNNSDKQIDDRLSLSLLDSLSEKKSNIGFEGPSAMLDNKVQEVKAKKLVENPSFSGMVSWVATQDRYFLASILLDEPGQATVAFSQLGEKQIETKIILPDMTLYPGGQQAYGFKAYFGPKSITILKSIGSRLEKVVDFGWFDVLARPCLWLMNLMYRFIPNYGVAIILLTVLIRIILWPLASKSYKSMKQMKRMQPLIAELRERYKDDKQKMNLEMMALYKTYKVNPMGGCLPMVAQFPVLLALYRMLYQAVELRHAPFLWWIKDLSAPDRLFSFDFKIPFMDAPYGIPVLTIAMGITQLIQQKMQPPMGDPAQAKMMMFMPVVFMFIFINFSSGLVLYWFVGNILSIMQQYYVNKRNN